MASNGAPTITGFTPTIGLAGTPVSISGTNFETIPSKNYVRVNIGLASATSATSTSISTTIPTAIASGRISVGTARGKAISAADFFIPPSPHTVADVQHTGRMAMGGPNHTVTLNTSNKIGLVVFDGAINQRVSLRVTNSTIPATDVSIIKPDGTTLMSPTYVGASGYFDTVTLPMTGTYTIFVNPQSTYTGNMTLTLYDVPPDVSATIVPGGSPVTITTTVPGQNANVTFSGTANQRVSLRITNVTIPNSDVYIR